MDDRIDQISPASQRDGHGVIEDVDSVTDVVLRAMSRTPNARLREIMESFVRHLHAFAREVRLTEVEYDVAIDFLNRIRFSAISSAQLAIPWSRAALADTKHAAQAMDGEFRG